MSHASYGDKARHCASEVHLRATKRILRYAKGIVDYGVKFERCHKFRFYGFSDSDWAGSIDDMKSTSRVFSWCTKKQEIVAQSIAEAKFITTSTIVNQALWLNFFM